MSKEALSAFPLPPIAAETPFAGRAAVMQPATAGVIPFAETEWRVGEAEERKVRYALALDLGSTSAKMSLTDINRLSPNSPDQKKYLREINYTGAVHKAEIPNRQGGKFVFKWVDGHDIIRTVSNGVFDIVSSCDQNPELAVVSGRSNNVVLTHTNPRGETQIRILNDDPSLASYDYTPEQREIFAKYIPGFSTTGKLKQASAINKMVTLINHPEVIEYLFGEGVRFEDLRFNSYIGAIAESFVEKSDGSGRKMLSAVPSSDLKSFAGTSYMTVERLREMMVKLGVRTEQLQFLGSHWVEEDAGIGDGEKLKWWFVQDLPADVFLIDTLRKEGKISDGVCILADTVGKVVFSFGKDVANIGTGIGNSRYVVQRMTGGVITDIIEGMLADDPRVNDKLILDYRGKDAIGSIWDPEKKEVSYPLDHYGDPGKKQLPLHRLIHGGRSFFNHFSVESNHSPVYDRVEQILQKSVFETDNPYYYFPEAGEDSPLGRLYVQDKGSFAEIELNAANLVKLDQKAKEQIVWAIAKGVGFGLREKTEKVARAKGKDLEDMTVYFQGGLVRRSGGWREVFAECFGATGHKHYLDIPNSGTSATFQAAIQFGMMHPMAVREFMDFYKTKRHITGLLDRSEEFGEWKNTRSQLLEEGKQTAVFRHEEKQ